MSFYLVYASFKTIQNDTTIVFQSSQTGGLMEYLALDPETQNAKQMVTHIESNLQNISAWVDQNDKSELYIGAESLSVDFSEVVACWEQYKKVIFSQDTTMIWKHALECREKSNALAIVIEKMVYLKQNKMINLFYFALAMAMLLTLLIIYMVRLYILKQMKKHAIHDHDTKLFNKKYFISELKITCSRSVRQNYPLSMLRITINDFENEDKTFTKRVKRNTLKVFGILINSLVRDGDIACRYDTNHFLILLPFTEEENALILKERIEQALKKDKWIKSKQITFDFHTAEFDHKESEEAFILRTLNAI